MNYIVGLMIVVFAVESNAADLPSNFKKCYHKSPDFLDCLSTAVTEAISTLGADGLKSFKILPIEPLAIDSVSIGDNGGVVSLKQDYKNIKVHGLTRGMRVNYKSIAPDMLSLQSTTYNDHVDFVGDYVMSGKILLLPITGNGRANVTLLNLRSENNVHFVKYEKNGDTYLKMTSYETKFFPEKVIFNFTNLFNGDPVLSTQMNKFLNENSEVVFKETQSSFEETFGLLFLNIANNIFSRVPFSKIYPD